MVYNIICMIVNLWLAVCTAGFYIMIYGDGGKVVYRWRAMQSFALRFGMVLLVAGAIWDAFSWRNNSLSALTSHLGLSLVFTWAYIYHKKMFKA